MRTFTAGTAVLLGTTAAADPIVFVNDNPDIALRSFLNELSGKPGDFMDITVDAYAQPADGYTNEQPPESFSLVPKPQSTSTDWEDVSIYPEGSLVAAISPDIVTFVTPNGNFTAEGVEDFNFGDTVGPAATWSASTSVGGEFLYFGFEYIQPPQPNSFFVRELFTLGLRFEIDGQTHYGFATILWPRLPNGGISFQGWTPVQWGYESTPDTPITIPAACPADFGFPFGSLNIFDIQEFIDLYGNQSDLADLAAPFGVWNIFDLQAYINLYNAGCP